MEFTFGPGKHGKSWNFQKKNYFLILIMNGLFKCFLTKDMIVIFIESKEYFCNLPFLAEHEVFNVFDCIQFLKKFKKIYNNFFKVLFQFKNIFFQKDFFLIFL